MEAFMIFDCITDIVLGDHYVILDGIAPHIKVHVKLEGLSVTGSIKVKPALYMLRQLEAAGRLSRGMRVVESSSGNLGLALGMVCAARGYQFTCISDPNISPQTARMIQAYGAELILVTNRDANGGFLGSRVALIESMLKQDPNLVWINQYANVNNLEAHYLATGPEILRHIPKPDFVFIGAGTTGTLGGVSKFLRAYSPSTHVIAVDAMGSVTFGKPSANRLIPGLGTSRPPAISKFARYDHLIMVKESDTLGMCHLLAKQGLLLGGSSGTVLSGVRQYADCIPAGSSVVAISPDMGDRYLETIYNPEWVAKHFPNVQMLEPQSKIRSTEQVPK